MLGNISKFNHIAILKHYRVWSYASYRPALVGGFQERAFSTDKFVHALVGVTILTRN